MTRMCLHEVTLSLLKYKHRLLLLLTQSVLPFPKYYLLPIQRFKAQRPRPRPLPRHISTTYYVLQHLTPPLYLSRQSNISYLMKDPPTFRSIPTQNTTVIRHRFTRPSQTPRPPRLSTQWGSLQRWTPRPLPHPPTGVTGLTTPPWLTPVQGWATITTHRAMHRATTTRKTHCSGIQSTRWVTSYLNCLPCS